MLTEYRFGINLIFSRYWFVILIKKDETKIMRSSFFRKIKVNNFCHLFTKPIDIFILSILVVITNLSLSIFTILITHLIIKIFFGIDLIRYLAKFY